MGLDIEQRRWIPDRVATAVHTVSHAYQTGAAYLVAALSYYALTALMPMILLTFVAIAYVGEIEAARAAIRRFGNLLTPRGQAFVLATVEDVARRTGIVVFAAAVAGASAVQILRTLDRAIALVYDVESARPASRLHDGLIVFPVTILAGVGMVANVAALTVFATPEQFRMAAPSVVFLASAITLFSVYVTVPNVAVPARDALPGTLFAAGAWAISGTIVGTYAAHSDGAALYGVLGGLLLLITWIYVANFALVLGAAINAVMAGHVDPSPPVDDGRAADGPASDTADATASDNTETATADGGTSSTRDD